jgi:hypothetical protein
VHTDLYFLEVLSVHKGAIPNSLMYINA